MVREAGENHAMMGEAERWGIVNFSVKEVRRRTLIWYEGNWNHRPVQDLLDVCGNVIEHGVYHYGRVNGESRHWIGIISPFCSLN